MHPTPAQPLTLEARTAILDREIARYVKRGFRLVTRTPTTAQLLKPKHFSFLWATFWLLCLVVGLLVYLFYYWSRRDQTIYLEVDPTGRIRKT